MLIAIIAAASSEREHGQNVKKVQTAGFSGKNGSVRKRGKKTIREICLAIAGSQRPGTSQPRQDHHTVAARRSIETVVKDAADISLIDIGNDSSRLIVAVCLTKVRNSV